MASPILISPDLTNAGYLPTGATLTGSLTSLFDGKTLNVDDTDLWQTVGTGTSNFTANRLDLSVAAGEYLICQSRRRMPYFSGKTQVMEYTTQNFESVPGVVKRIGYFSSNNEAPYASNLDGVWYEDDGTTKYIKAANNGVETISIPLEYWENAWRDYDFSKFTVLQQYLLWLGGTALINFGAQDYRGFLFQAAGQHVGVNSGYICASPNQPVRYEIRSTTGEGTLSRCCSQVANAGSIFEAGKALGIYNATAVSCDSIGTVYALKGIRKRADRRDVSVKIENVSITSNSTSDAGIMLLLRNPTLSAPLTYANNNNIQEASGTGQTVSALGRVIRAVPCEQTAEKLDLKTDYLTWLSGGIDDTMDEFVLAFAPTTTHQSRVGALNVTEYI